MGNRPTQLRGSAVAVLVGLTEDHIDEFSDMGVTTLTDLMLLDAEDFKNILGDEAPTFIQRKRLFAIVEYMKQGNNVDANTLMHNVIRDSYGANTTATCMTIMIAVCSSLVASISFQYF